MWIKWNHYKEKNIIKSELKNGKIDLGFIDDDENGFVEGTLIDKDEDGVWEIFIIDSDENGKADQAYLDNDGELKSFDKFSTQLSQIRKSVPNELEKTTVGLFAPLLV